MVGCNAIVTGGGKCAKKKQLTHIVFSDPIKKTCETILLCQEHRDNIIRPYLKRYNQLVNDIEVAKGRKNKKQRFARHYEFVDDPNVSDELKKAYDERHRHTFYECRNPLCDISTKLSNVVYTAVSFGQDGRMAHVLYFHNECFEELKRKCGNIKIQKSYQTALS